MKRQNKGMMSHLKAALPWVALGIALLLALNALTDGNDRSKPVPVSELHKLVQAQQVTAVKVDGQDVTAVTKDGRKLATTLPPTSALMSEMMAAGVQVSVKPEREPSAMWQIFLSWGPVLLMLGVWVYFLKAQSGAMKGKMPGDFSKTRARTQDPSANTVTFADVAGCDEAKEEVREIVDFLKDPAKFQRLGGRIPAGVLLSGEPGTGKTLLAKAIAGEAGVPFFSISGSDFVEMFVGVGASRVRDLFTNAKRHPSAIIFIDEIDAVGRKRGAGTGGGNDEREQTLNQLLVEMDGFDDSNGVIVIAATNRPDVLDEALKRPGRFDRQVSVGLPDVRGREQILNVHLRKVPVSVDVSAVTLARGTPGFSGADLMNLVNEAALTAARANKVRVDMSDFETAKDKLIMGSERRSIKMPEHERVTTAYHEAGHAIIAKLLPTADPVHKVSIVPRGRALGVTVQLPENDRYSLGKKRILDEIAILFGGRVAEELYTDDITTGASNDYERANALARNLVTRWGMSAEVGPMVIGKNDPFAPATPVAAKTLEAADAAVREVLDSQYRRASDILKGHREPMEAMVQALLTWETIDADQVEDIMKGIEPRPPKGSVTPANIVRPVTPVSASADAAVPAV